MDQKQFWEIIDRVNNESKGAMGVKCELLRKELITISDDELKQFSFYFDQANVNAYTWKLWGAANILKEGCSDDSFDDFRTTLISLGNSIYTNALADPNTLAKVKFDCDEPCYEGFQYAVNDALLERFKALTKSEVHFPSTPSGKKWSEEEIEKQFPDLQFIENSQSSKSNKPWWKFW